MNIDNFEEKVKAYALKNALAHDGLASSGPVISSLFNEGLEKSDMKEYGKRINELILEVNNLSDEEKVIEFDKVKGLVLEREVREGLQELPNAEKGIITRFAPSPSGGLHIGHAATMGIAYAYVKKYGGKLIVRIEDTNPDNIYPLAYKLIEEDAKWFTRNNCEVVIQSDRMELYYKMAEELIQKGFSYVCTCSGDAFRELSKDKKECPCRNLSEEENMARWESMLDSKGYKPGEVVLRFKSDMKHPNPAMRDFPLARINLNSHPRTKNKYRVWPLMNLSVTADDIEMKLTHIIRAKDHMDNAKRQKLIYAALGYQFPWNAFMGLYKFSDLDLSSTKITQGIKDGKYSGWDDESLPTLSALRKKGYSPEAFLAMAENRGLSEVDKTIDKKEYFKLLDKFDKE